MEIFFEQSDLSVINRIPDTRDRMPRPQPLCDQTAQHVAFICRCTRNHKIRMGYVRLSLYFCIRPVSCHTGNIKTINGKPEFFLITIDQHHIIIFDRKLLCKFIPYFSIPDNHYFHFFFLNKCLYNSYSRAIIAPLTIKYNINGSFLTKAGAGVCGETKAVPDRYLYALAQPLFC